MRRLPAATLFVVGLAVATMAVAQGKKPPRGKAPAKPKPAAAVAPKGSDTPDSKAAEGDTSPYDAPAAPASSAGDAPDKPELPSSPLPTVSDAGIKSSPLNPRPEELPDGGGQVVTSADLEKVLGDIAALRA